MAESATDRTGRRVEAVLLDLDDTLFDHRTSARRGVARYVQELGEEAAPEVLESWETTAQHLMARRRAGEIDRATYRHERVRSLLRDLGRDGASALEAAECEEIYGRILDRYEQEWVAFDDALPALRALRRRGIPTAVLTNGPEERQQRKVRALGISPWVVGVWTSELLAAKKPDSATYLTVCEALEVAPQQVLHVGDDRELDLDGALAAGLQALHLDRDGRHPASPQRIGGLDELLARI
ncbi:HAD family hydrolase [Brachybacterium sp. AOP43-C2-M15]|uniref:HAD family hydrolase n=1 Tax=Brachybacterium sp. AOP43-C2-M15 TaxID=3457661 RepID=UPI0040349511